MAVERRSTMLAVLLICAGLLQTSSAVEHIVGDSTGWTTMSAGSTFYDDWAKGKTFVVGDTLRFQWTSVHDVLQVTPADANACNPANPTQTSNESPAVVTLDSAGDFGFLCSISDHCSRGMKLTVTVNAVAPSPPTTTPGASPPPPTSTAPPLTSTTPPPPPSPKDSSASSFSCNSLLVAMLALVAALATLLV